MDPIVPCTGTPIATLLAALEERSRARPDRVLRLRGELALAPLPQETATERAGDADPPAREPFELLIFRGFSSLTTHPTAFDPDRPALPEGSTITSAELLAAPLTAEGGPVLQAAAAAEPFLEISAWL